MKSRLAGGIVCLLLLNLPAQGQEQSPVFKSTPRPRDVPRIRSADPTYEVLQTFLVARKASAGDMVAQHELGVRYFLGRGVAADTAEAARWIAQSAAQNYMPARFTLGILLYNGWGTAWDPFQSYRQLSICAERGMPAAQYLFSIFFMDDLVVPRNWTRAREWLEKASRAGYEPAADALGEISAYERAEAARDSAEAQPETKAGLPPIPLFAGVDEDTSSEDEGTVLRAALDGAGPEVRRALGLAENIDAVTRIDSATLASITRAAGAGSPEALTLLGRCYERGISVKRDRMAALTQYLSGVRVDAPRAMPLLDAMLREEELFAEMKHRSGSGDTDALFAWSALARGGFLYVLISHAAAITEPQARSMLRRAALAGHVPALIELGLLAYGGGPSSQGTDSARALWHQAVMRGSREAEIRLAILELRLQPDSTLARQSILVLREGIREGSVLAEVGLGACYETGTGLAQNLSEAVQLYRLAARRGNRDAYAALQRLHDRLRPSEEEFRH